MLRPVRVKNIIAAPYEDLKKLQEKLGDISSDTYTEALANETTGCGDCCSMRIIERGHSLNSLVEDVTKFDDEDHMAAVGEYFISVNETVLLADNNVFNLAEDDGDSRNPLIVHCAPTDTTHSEVQQYKDPETKKRKAQNRKERQNQNRMKGWSTGQKEEEESDDGEWHESWYCYQSRGRFEGRYNHHHWSSSSSSYAPRGGKSYGKGKEWRRRD